MNPQISLIMDPNSPRSNNTSNYYTTSNGSTRDRNLTRGTSSERTPLMQHPPHSPTEENDTRSIRSGRSAWTDVSVHTQSAPSIIPNRIQSQGNQIPQVPQYPEFDARSIRSERSSSTVHAQGTLSIPPSNPSSPRPSSFPNSDITLVEPSSERIWSTQGGSGGQRMAIYYNRGILTRAGSREDQDKWPDALRAILNPCPINDMDLFEEALESPGSGVHFVGRSVRDTVKGNEPLARVGEAAMRLILRDQCYLLKYGGDMTNRVIDQMLSRDRLFDVGKNSRIETWIRPMKPIKPAKKNNLLSLLRDDAKVVGHDKTRTIARAVKAIAGAVYYDQGYEWVKKVMFQWGLIIQMP